MRKSPNLSDVQRQARREMILKKKPWLRATGPTTTDGKAKAAQRWRRHGMRSDEMRIARQWLRSIALLIAALGPVNGGASIEEL